MHKLGIGLWLRNINKGYYSAVFQIGRLNHKAGFFPNFPYGTILRGLAVFALAAYSYPLLPIIILLFIVTLEHDIRVIFFYITECSIYKGFHIFFGVPLILCYNIYNIREDL